MTTTEPTTEAALVGSFDSADGIPDHGEGVARIVQLAKAAAGHHTTPIRDGNLLVYPGVHTNDEIKVINLDQIRRNDAKAAADQVDRKAGTYTVVDVDSFLAYYDKHATQFAETWVAKSGARAVLNAHSDDEGADGHRDEHHILQLALTMSPEWKRWTSVSGRWVDANEFAEWLEGAAGDITDPTSADVLEVVSSLHATSKAEFGSTRRHGGVVSVGYALTSTVKAGQKGEVEIPTVLTARLRVFTAVPSFDIKVRFRVQVAGESLRLGIVIDRVDDICEAAVGAVRAAIVEGIDRGIVLAAG